MNGPGFRRFLAKPIIVARRQRHCSWEMAVWVSRNCQRRLFVTIVSGLFAVQCGLYVLLSSQKDILWQLKFTTWICEAAKSDKPLAVVEGSWEWEQEMRLLRQHCLSVTEEIQCKRIKVCAWKEGYPDTLTWLLIHLPGVVLSAVFSLGFAKRIVELKACHFRLPLGNRESMTLFSYVLGLGTFAVFMGLLPFFKNWLIFVPSETFALLCATVSQNIGIMCVCSFHFSIPRGMSFWIAGVAVVLGAEAGRLLAAFAPFFQCSCMTVVVLSGICAASIALQAVSWWTYNLRTTSPPSPVDLELRQQNEELPSTSIRQENVTHQPQDAGVSSGQGVDCQGWNTSSLGFGIYWCLFLVIAGYQFDMVAFQGWRWLNFYYLESTMSSPMFVVYTAAVSSLYGLPVNLFCTCMTDRLVKLGKPNVIYLVVHVAFRLCKMACLIFILLKFGASKPVQIVVLCLYEAARSNLIFPYVVRRCPPKYLVRTVAILNSFCFLSSHVTTLTVVLLKDLLSWHWALFVLIGGSTAMCILMYSMAIVIELRKHPKISGNQRGDIDLITFFPF